MNATVEHIDRHKRLAARIALLMASEALDNARVRVDALAGAVSRGHYSDTMHATALSHIDQAVRELKRAEAHTMFLDNEDGDHAA